MKTTYKASQKPKNSSFKLEETDSINDVKAEEHLNVFLPSDSNHVLLENPEQVNHSVNTPLENETTPQGCNNLIFAEEIIFSQANNYYEWKSIRHCTPFSSFALFSKHLPSPFLSTKDPLINSLSLLPDVQELRPGQLKIVEPHQQQICFGVESIEKLSNNSHSSIEDAIDEKTNDDNIMCKVCQDNKVCVFFYPCGHIQTCKACSEELAKNKSRCLICNKEIKSMHRAFL